VSVRADLFLAGDYHRLDVDLTAQLLHDKHRENTKHPKPEKK